MPSTNWITFIHIFSSPDLLGSQDELIVYPWSRCPSVVHHFQRSSALKPLGQSNPNFMWSNQSLYKWSRSHNHVGHHACIWSKPLKNLKRTGRPMILKLGLQHLGLKFFKIYINDDPAMTLTYFTARSNLVTYAFKCLIRVKLAAYDQINRKFHIFEIILMPGGCLAWGLTLLWGYIHDMTIIFKHLFSLKRLANQSQI